jgi:hypothetical protein
LPTNKKFKSVPSAGKVMTLFRDFKGLILKHYQDHRQMVNSAQYCAMLEEEMKLTICSKHRGMLKNGVFYIMTILDHI